MINLFNEDCLIGMKRIPDGSVDFILTDLPFGITDAPFDKRIPFEPMWEQFLRVAKPNAAIALFAAGKFLIELAASNLKLYRYKWVWRKNLGTGFLNANKMPLRCHEDILLFYRKLPTFNPQFTEGKPWSRKGIRQSLNYSKGQAHLQDYQNDGRRYPFDELKYAIPYASAETCYHSTQKPIELLGYLIRTYTNAGELVLDATMGSGSTGVAAVNEGRRFIGFETERKFFEIAQKRIDEALAERQQGLFLMEGTQ